MGAVPPAECAARRRLVVTAEVPALSVAPGAPAWTQVTGQTLARDLVGRLQAHPAVTLARVVEAAQSATDLPAGLDYTALTRGRPRAQPGDHVFSPAIEIAEVPAAGGLGLRLGVRLSMTGPDGVTRRRVVSNDVAIPRTALARSLTGRHRTRAEAALTRGVAAALDTMLDGLSCAAPAAQAVLAGGTLSVPIGTRHGLGRDSLGLVEGRGTSFGLLEIVSLGRDSAVLRPLDPARAPADFANARLYFLRAGLGG